MDKTTDSRLLKNDDQNEILTELKSFFPEKSFVVNNSVLIEELDLTTVGNRNFNMNEFVEAETITISKMPKNLLVNSIDHIDYNMTTKLNFGEQSLVSTEEENILTKKFLDGELTFYEFSIKIDQDIDMESDEYESKNTRKNRTDAEQNTTMNTSKYVKNGPHRPKRRRNLPTALQGLMGEANLRYARGEIELASKMCMEIIRQVPNAPEPFHTLSMIYENDQPEKALQFALIAAHLNPRDSDQWVRLANSSLEFGNLRQALTCYSKAIQADPKNIELYEIRAKLQEQYGDRKAFIRAYTKLLQQLGPEDGQQILKYAKLLTKHCMQEHLYEIAFEGMDNIFKKCPELVTLEEVNVMTEILIVLKEFNKCLNILTKYTKIMIDYKFNQFEPLLAINKDSNISLCNIPDGLAVDLKAKCIISLIGLNEILVVDTLIINFRALENPEVSGDLFLDIAESFMDKKEFRRALNLLESLVSSKNFSLAAVWLRHAQCWVGCQDTNKAIKSFEIVRKLSPQHLGARIELSRLYKLKGLFNKAIQVLKQNTAKDILDPHIMYRKTELLFKVRKYNEYFRCGILLLSRHCVPLRSKLELTALSRTSGVRQRMEILHRNRLSRGELLQDDMPVFSTNNELTAKQELFLLIHMCHLACKLKKYGLLQRICFTALTSKKYAKENNQLVYLCLISCVHNNDSYNGFNIVRELVKNCSRPNIWNILNIIIQRAEDCRHNRFIMRQLGKEDAFSYLHILHANNCLVSGTYKYALNDYTSLFKVKPSCLLALLVSVTLLQMACQKFSAKKSKLVIQVIAFMKTYMNLRGEQASQEICYNMARSLHQLGLLSSAIYFYKKVLNIPVSEVIGKNLNFLDLKKEAAFNLHLIYVHTDNDQLARMYLENYIMIR